MFGLTPMRTASASLSSAGVVDPDSGELGAQLEPVARIARVGFDERHGHVEAGPELEARAAGPDAGASRQTAVAPTYSTRPVAAGRPMFASAPFCRPSRMPSSAVNSAALSGAMT